MTATHLVKFDDLAGLVGTSYGPGEWMEISQERINTFADATDDHQFIHVDPERAKDSPFGGTIAHGFLTLSLVIPLWGALFDVEGVSTKVNYGLDKVRFITPVKAGSRVRMSFVLAAVDEVKGGVQIKVDATIELEGSERPAVAVEFLARFYA